jgi:tetratricopeptide (TPR) repeat protein
MLAMYRISLALALAVVSFAPIASAQQPLSSEEQQARSLFEAGRTAYEAGRFEQALRYFEESYELSHRAGLLFNIASAADRLQQNERALEAYRQYLREVPNAENRELAQSRIDFLEARTGGGDVPTPEETARRDTERDSGRTDSSSGGDVTGEWWFWTLIAVLVVGAGVGITVGVVVSTSGVEQPLEGDVPTFTALLEF